LHCVRGETDAVNETWQQRNRRLSGSPPSFAESPLAAFWEHASDRHVQAADNIACIRETRREVEAQQRRLRLALGPGKRVPVGRPFSP
jgi:hypothetical protein